MLLLRSEKRLLTCRQPSSLITRRLWLRRIAVILRHPVRQTYHADIHNRYACVYVACIHMYMYTCVTRQRLLHRRVN